MRRAAAAGQHRGSFRMPAAALTQQIPPEEQVMSGGKFDRVLGTDRREKGEKYRARVLASEDPREFVRGMPEDRVHGLESALSLAAGRTVLDLGCHTGTVALAFSGSGAALIDGVDLSPTCVEAARKAFSDQPTDSHFAVCDLALGFSELRRHTRRQHYDIVCYLALHQHLLKQMAPSDVAKFEDEVIAIATDLFILRTPPALFGGVEAAVLAQGFEPLTGIIHGSVDPVRSYRRRG